MGLCGPVGEAVEGAEEEQGEVQGVGVAPRSAAVPFGGGATSWARYRQSSRTSLGLGSLRTKPRLPISGNA